MGLKGERQKEEENTCDTEVSGWSGAGDGVTKERRGVNIKRL